MIYKLRVMANDKESFEETVYSTKKAAEQAKEELKENYIHVCHHDENPPRPCTLEKVK